MSTTKIQELPEVSKIRPDLIAEFKDKVIELNTAAGEKMFTFQSVAEASNLHPQTIYSTFDSGRRHFNREAFQLACDMLKTAIEEHNTRVAAYNERLEEIAALEILQEYDQ